MPSPSSDQLLLKIEQLQIQYPIQKNYLHVINNIDLEIKSGETMGLVGESGCGKSTLAMAMMGLLPKNTILKQHQFCFKQKALPVLGSPEWKPLRGPQMGMIFQNPMSSLNPFLNIRTQMCEGLKHHFKMNTQAAETEALRWLNEVQITNPEGVLHQYPHQLSGGMCQRIMIAMVLSLKPSLLIADEPTTALDVKTQATILTLLKDLQRKYGMAMLLVSHDIGLIASSCERVSVMYAGEIIESGPCKNVLNTPHHPYTQSLLAARPTLQGACPTELQALPGQAPQLYAPSKECSLRPRCPKAHDVCEAKPAMKYVNPYHQFCCHLES